ncbi:DNA alkylation repair protein [Patescibacteria group bacterium]
MAMTIELKKEMKALGDSERAKNALWFFKTGKGEYGEGDKFLGITVPLQRKVAKKYRDLPLVEVEKLLQSPIHEHRLTALFILVDQFNKADEAGKARIYKLYLKNTKYINNWDLVDSSAHFIVGGYLLDRPRDVLYKMARSRDLWKKRIAVLATFMFIREDDFKDALRISEILLQDEHDLIHKAVGWMLREVGNRDQATEEKFLKKHHKKMPRTMLRYAIEKFDEKKRQAYLEQ